MAAAQPFRHHEVENLSGWLTTVVARLCLDRLRSRKSRREQPLEEEFESIPDPASLEREALLAESIGMAMLTVLQRLAPAERVAFVLHDVFGVPFDEIAGIVGRSPRANSPAAAGAACRGSRRTAAPLTSRDSGPLRNGWIKSELRGANAVAEQFAGRAQAAQLALIEGMPAVVWTTGGIPRVAFLFTIQNGKVTEIALAADPKQLSRLKIELLP